MLDVSIRCVWPGMPKLPKTKSLLFLCNILTKLIFCKQVSMNTYYKLILWFWWGWSGISKAPKIATLQYYLYNVSKNKWEMKLIFCMQVNMKVTCKLISTLWAPKFPVRWYYHLWHLWHYMKHSQDIQSNKFANLFKSISKKKLGMAHIFLHADKHQSFQKLALSFLMEAARHVQSI